VDYRQEKGRSIRHQKMGEILLGINAIDSPSRSATILYLLGEGRPHPLNGLTNRGGTLEGVRRSTNSDCLNIGERNLVILKKKQAASRGIRTANVKLSNKRGIRAFVRWGVNAESENERSC